MKTIKRFLCLTTITVLGILLIIFCGLKFLRHERNQNIRITELQQQIVILTQRIAILKNNYSTNQNAIAFSNKCKTYNGGGITTWQLETALPITIYVTIGGTNVAWQQL